MGQSILLVDDDADVRALLGEFLTGEGFVVHAARDGRHALQLLAHMDAPDLILLDYKMPVMNGSQFLARRRWNPRLRGIPVVILSAWSRQWAGARLDAVEVLSKPVDLDRLLSLVHRACDRVPSIRIPARRADNLSAGAFGRGRETAVRRGS
ncbi:MAG: response regulator [Gemmatimonadales bacterium]